LLCVEGNSFADDCIGSMCMHYFYNSTFPPKSPNHLLTTSSRPPRGPFSNAAKPTSKHPRQFLRSVSNADNIRATRFDDDIFD
jgi:hypothetical protein